jgi:hypothetical protein
MTLVSYLACTKTHVTPRVEKFYESGVDSCQYVIAEKSGQTKPRHRGDAALCGGRPVAAADSGRRHGVRPVDARITELG